MANITQFLQRAEIAANGFADEFLMSLKALPLDDPTKWMTIGKLITLTQEK